MRNQPNYPPRIGPVNTGWRSLFICLIGTVALYLQIRSANHKGLLQTAENLILAVMALLFLVWIIRKDRSAWQHTNRITSFFPSALAILILLSLIVMQFFLNKRDASPTLLYFSTGSGFSGAAIDFRADGTYRVSNYCMGVDYFRGTYTMQDSLFILDKSGIGDCIESNRLVMRPFHPDKGVPKALYQVDDSGRDIRSPIVFYLRQDHRK